MVPLGMRGGVASAVALDAAALELGLEARLDRIILQINGYAGFTPPSRLSSPTWERAMAAELKRGWRWTHTTRLLSKSYRPLKNGSQQQTRKVKGV